VLVPKGIYKPNDENPTEIEYEEEVPPVVTEELASPENWVHLHPAILGVGRVSHRITEVPEGKRTLSLKSFLRS
jgi:hypothetical protein